MILITGGSGFIGSQFVLDWLAGTAEPVVVLDKLTYAGNRENLASVAQDPRLVFVQGDIGDAALLATLLARHAPRAVLHLAAESHVDRSIHGPEAFVQTNVVGTFRLLAAVRGWWAGLEAGQRAGFRFLHVSTDEVYGSLAPDAPAFTEQSPYAPNNPYAASKAAGDHLARAYHATYGLPVLTTHCSDNFGPRHFPEKLIPLMVLNALAGRPLPVYGDGQQVRDWIHVRDHCRALRRVLEAGVPGQTYNIGAGSERTNLEVVHAVCRVLDELRPRAGGGSYASQVALVADRPGHDRRYAVDAGKARRELGWQAQESFEEGIRETVAWYLRNPGWVHRVQSGAYRAWMKRQYGD